MDRITEGPKRLVAEPDSYMQLWHWRLEGSNRAIGDALARWGADELGAHPFPSADPAITAMQRAFFRKHFPPFAERMNGVADAHGISAGDDPFDLAALWFDVGGRVGCSAAFVPGNRTVSSHGAVLRNMDLRADLTGEVVPPSSSRLMALEFHPDTGYATLNCVVFDLVCAMDGINEKGLVVICNSHRDYNLSTSYSHEPTNRAEPGLNELQAVRYLLGMCADVQEAKEALFSLRTYYVHTPCLYLLADPSGRSTVVER